MNKSLSVIRRQLQIAFITSAVIGFAIILMFVQTNRDKYALWLPVFVMLFYILFGQQISSKYKYLPEFADSVYYLGFTFTLESLLAATIFEKLSADPSKTISYFGMALMTTIVGLIYRNYHMQFTDLNEDVYEKAKNQIAEEMSYFKLTVDDTKSRLESLTKNIENISNSLTETLPNKLTEAVENVDVRLLTAFSKLENDMNDMDILFKESISQVFTLYSELNQNNTTAINAIINSLEGFSNNFVNSIKTIESASTQTAQLAENLKNNIVIFNDQLSNNSEGDGYLDTAIITIKDSVEELTELSKLIKNLNESFNNSLESLKKTSETITLEISQIEKIFEDVESHIIKNFS